MREHSVTFVAVGDVMLDVAVAGGAGDHDAVARVRTGGTAVNAAVAAAAAGARATAVGRAGDDDGGAAVRAALAAAGVRDGVAHAADEATGVVLRLDGRLHVDRGANRGLRPEHVAAERADALLVSGFALLHEDTRAAGRAALAAGAAWTGATGGSAGLAARAGVDAFAGARVLVVDAEEARALTGSAPEEAARQLASRHELACVTLGAAGAVLAGPGDASLRRAAPPPELVLKQHKLRGAGDAFAAVLLVELARGAEPEAALAAACAAGASVDAR